MDMGTEMQERGRGRENGLRKAAALTAAFALIFAALITSFEIAMYADFDIYRKEYEKYDVLTQLDMTMEDAMYVTREMMAYLRGDREELSVMTTVEGKEQDFFNEQDRFHMGEVRELFIGGLDLRLGACAIAVGCLVLLVFSRADLGRILPWAYRRALAVCAAAVLLLGAACMIDFNAVFVQFHHIFFDNDLWLFDPAEDFMIRMLPEGLFYDMVMRIGGIFAGFLILFFLLSLLPRVRARVQRREPSAPAGDHKIS